MKLSTAALFLFLGSASAAREWKLEKPKLTIHLKNGPGANPDTLLGGKFAVHEVAAMKPDLSIKGSCGEDIEVGATLGVDKFCCQFHPLPPHVHLGSGSVWGKLKSTHGNYNWTTKLEASNERYDFGDGTMQGVYGTVQGTNEQKDTFVWASGALSTTGTRAGTISPLKVGAKKIMAVPADVGNNNGKVLLSTRHDFEDDESHVVVGYEKDYTQAYVTVSRKLIGMYNLHVKHTINDSTSASTKLDRSGILSASVTHDSDQYGSTTITYKPEELDLTVTKDGWMAGISTVGQPGVGGHFWPVRDDHGQGHDLKVRMNKSMSWGNGFGK